MDTEDTVGRPRRTTTRSLRGREHDEYIETQEEQPPNKKARKEVEMEDQTPVRHARKDFNQIPKGQRKKLADNHRVVPNQEEEIDLVTDEAADIQFEEEEEAPVAGQSSEGAAKQKSDAPDWNRLLDGMVAQHTQHMDMMAESMATMRDWMLAQQTMMQDSLERMEQRMERAVAAREQRAQAALPCSVQQGMQRAHSDADLS